MPGRRFHFHCETTFTQSARSIRATHFHKKEFPMLLVNASSQPSRIHRLGLFANESIPAGCKIAEYRDGFDLALTEAQVAALPQAVQEQFLRHAFWSTVLQRHVCDGDDGRFTNHSEQPNSQQSGLASFALRAIAQGEEITLDYGALDGDVPGSPICSTATLWLINGVSGLYLDRSQTGWGLFAGKRFSQGEPILNFSGPELSLQETLSLGAWSMYPVQIGLDRYVDCGPPGVRNLLWTIHAPCQVIRRATCPANAAGHAAAGRSPILKTFLRRCGWSFCTGKSLRTSLFQSMLHPDSIVASGQQLSP